MHLSIKSISHGEQRYELLIGSLLCHFLKIRIASLPQSNAKYLFFDLALILKQPTIATAISIKIGTFSMFTAKYRHIPRLSTTLCAIYQLIHILQITDSNNILMVLFIAIYLAITMAAIQQLIVALRMRFVLLTNAMNPRVL